MPDSGFAGDDSFVHGAYDGTSLSDEVSVHIAVLGDGAPAHRLFLPTIER